MNYFINESNDIPIVKMFVYQGKNYIYDTFNNQLLNVNSEQFVEVGELCKYGLDKYKNINKKTKAYEDVLMLIERGYFRREWITEIKHIETDHVESILERGINSLILQVTQSCNFKCRYCAYAKEGDINHNIGRNHSQKNMSWDIAKQSVDFLWEHSKDEWGISISFYGGEPLLNFDLIKKIVDYSKKKFETKSLKFVMTTNGSVITDEIIDFLVKNDVVLTFSLDGPEYLHNRHRKFLDNGNDTFAIVWNNIEKIKANNQKYFENNIYFLPVLLPGDSVAEVLSFFENASVERKKVRLTNGNTKGIDYISSYSDLYNSKNVNDEDIESKQDDFLSRPLLTFKKIFNDKRYIPKVWHHGGPCMPARFKMFINTEGLIFPCEKVIESAANSIGEIYTGICIEKATSLLNIGKLSEEDCKNCYAMHYCDICMVRCYDPEKDKISYSQKTIRCKQVRDDLVQNMKNYISEKELNQKVSP